MNPSSSVSGVTASTTITQSDSASLEVLLQLLGAQRSRALEQSVRNEATENRASNAKVNRLNAALQFLSAAEPSSDKASVAFRINPGDEVTRTLKEITFDPSLKTNAFDKFSFFDGQSLQQKIRNDGDFARMREVVRTEVDKASSDSQLNLIRMQGIINRSNQATEFITNIVQRFSGVEDRINPNFRQ